MKTRLILKAGQKGTENLVKKYGDDLLLVGFKHDSELHQYGKIAGTALEKHIYVDAS